MSTTLVGRYFSTHGTSYVLLPLVLDEDEAIVVPREAEPLFPLGGKLPGLREKPLYLVSDQNKQNSRERPANKKDAIGRIYKKIIWIYLLT